MAWNIDAALLNHYGLYLENIQIFKQNILTVVRPEWEYQQALAFQLWCQAQVKQDRQLQAFIFCNHPHCFTMGRGLQRMRGKVLSELTEFDTALAASLPFPLHKIARGGGITFHYPGQWIIYPIINLNHQDYSLSSVVDLLFGITTRVLAKDYQVEVTDKQSELIGLWYQNRKLASLGIAIDHFVTSHGIAINLLYDQPMFQALALINPCGMQSEVYACLDQVTSIKNAEALIPSFHKSFIQELKQVLGIF